MSESPTINVPARAVPVFELLGTLDEQSASALVATLANEPVFTSVGDLEHRIDAILHDSERGDTRTAHNVVLELFGLAGMATSHDYDPAGVGTAIASSSRLDLDDHQREHLAALLPKLLGSLAVKTLGKASALANEHDHLLHIARIVTDITPIFDDVDQEPVGALVAHRLRLNYWNAPGEKEIEIALSSKQLDELGEAIDRAKAKTDSLQRMLNRISLAAFDPDDGRR